jgi:hypothetical protein
MDKRLGRVYKSSSPPVIIDIVDEMPKYHKVPNPYKVPEISETRVEVICTEIEKHKDNNVLVLSNNWKELDIIRERLKDKRM